MKGVAENPFFVANRQTFRLGGMVSKLVGPFLVGGHNLSLCQRYTYREIQTIQMKLILLCVWAEPAVLGSTKTALKLKYDISIG